MSNTAMTAGASIHEIAHGYGDDAAVGIANVGDDFLLVPQLKLLQGQSPAALDPENDARAGQFYIESMDRAFPIQVGVVAVPAKVWRKWVEWPPREEDGKSSGGSPIEEYSPEDDIVKEAVSRCEFGDVTTKEGNPLVDTYYIAMVILDDNGEPLPYSLFFACSRTAIKPFRAWFSRIASFQVRTPSGKKQTPPLFAHRIKVTSELKKNTRGEQYFIPKFSPALDSMTDSLIDPDSEAYLSAKRASEMLADGSSSIKHDAETKEENTDFPPKGKDGVF